MAASWDWVQDATTATHKWGDIAEWDTSAITTMEFAFSTNRNKLGVGREIRQSSPENAKAATFNGDVSKWTTSDVTSLRAMFYGAAAFNGALGNWITSKVRMVGLACLWGEKL